MSLLPVWMRRRSDLYTSSADVIVYQDDNGYAYALDTKTKKIIMRSDDHAEVMMSLDGMKDVLKIVVTNDLTVSKPINYTKTKYLEINFLGNKITGNAGGDYAPTIHYEFNEGTFIIRNVEIDNQGVVGDGITVGGDGSYPELVVIDNVLIKNFTNHGIYLISADPTVDASGDTRHDIIIHNTRIETSNSLNECITIDNARKIMVSKTELIGNKASLLVGAIIDVNSLRYNSSSYGPSLRGKTIFARNIEASGTGSNFVIEIYATANYGNILSSCELAIIDGFHGMDNSSRIQLRPYDDTYILKHVIISNVTQKQTAIQIEPFTNYGTIDTLEVKNVKFLEYSFQYQALRIINTTINKLVMDSIELPGINTTYTRAIYVQNDKADRVINAYIGSITKVLPYVGESNDGGAGYGVSGYFSIDRSLYDTFWKLTSGTTQPKLLNNSGKYVTSGDGTTTQFTIQHGLVSTPSRVLVTPCSLDAAGTMYVTVDSTNIYVNYSVAPPAGTNNVCLYWWAEV